MKIEGAPVDTIGLDKAKCFGKFNRKELTQVDIYHKPDCLRKKMMFASRVGQGRLQPKLNGQAMHDFVAAAIDPKDGGLMLCWAKHGTWPRNQLCKLCHCKPCNCNGMLPYVKTCSEFISSETQKKKKKAKKTVDLQSVAGGAKSGE